MPNDNKQKPILIVNQSAPYGNANAKESLDLALASSAFEQALSILFTGDGIYQLLPEQSPDGIQSKNLLQMLKALPIYGVEQLYVDQQSLTVRGITELDTHLPIVLVNSVEISRLYHDAQTVFRF